MQKRYRQTLLENVPKINFITKISLHTNDIGQSFLIWADRGWAGLGGRVNGPVRPNAFWVIGKGLHFQTGQNSKIGAFSMSGNIRLHILCMAKNSQNSTVGSFLSF